MLLKIIGDLEIRKDELKRAEFFYSYGTSFQLSYMVLILQNFPNI